MRVDSTIASIRQGALLAFAGFARGALLITTLTTAAIILIVTILQTFGGVTLAELTSSIRTVQQWRSWLEGFGQVWGGIVITVMVIALSVYARRRGKQRMEAAFKRVFDRELERLETEYNEGEWKELPPTPDMKQLEARIIEADEILEQISQHDPSDPQVAQAQQHLTRQVQEMAQYHQSLDIHRRINLKLDPEEAELPRPRTRWEKSQAFLMSRGLMASLGAGSRALFLASYILLAPSLMSVYAIGTGKILDEHVVKLQELRVELDQKEWDKTKAQLGEPKGELSEEDKETLRNVAREFEAAMPVPHVAARVAWYTMRSSLVRQEILTRAVHRSPTLLEQHPSGSKVSSLDAVEREILVLPEGALNKRGPLTPIGQKAYLELEDIAKRSPSFMEKVRIGFREFQRPAKVYDLTRMTLTHVASTLTGFESSGFDKFIQSTGVKFDRNKFRITHQDRLRQFVFGLMGNEALESALNNLGETASPGFRGSAYDFAEYQNIMRTVAEKLPIDNINTKTNYSPPSIDALPEPHADLPKASAKVEDLMRYNSTLGRAGASAQLADALALYQDWFPGQLDADRRTYRGMAISAEEGAAAGTGSGGGFGGGGGGVRSGGGPGGSGFGSGGTGVRVGGSGVNIASSNASRGSFLRARSFGGLRGFSRVGGVLIGREPSDFMASKLDCADMQWEVEGQNIRLVLVTADGRKIRSQPHRMTLVYQALNYAADGRPLAVTMASAKPVTELKILLHPALIDTSLGYRVVELDRFVDQYTSLDQKLGEARREAMDRVYAQAALYKLAWAQRLLAALEGNTSVGQIQKELRSVVQNPKIQKMAGKALADADSLGNPELSPLTVKKEFFDESLVSAMLKYAKLSSEPPQFVQSIDYWAKVELNAASDRETLLNNWVRFPPDFEVWSGVREREFDSDPANFMWLDGAAAPKPFDFMLQIAFTTPPYFGSEGQSEQSESFSDSQPWEFPSIRNTIQEQVIKNITQDREKTILSDVAEFTILQRMFRMAFNGYLGPNFPVEKLALLSDVTASGAPKTATRTLRWNARPGAVEMMTALGELSGEDPKITQLAIEIRRLLGVAKDDEQISRERNAPLPKLDQ
ncbi:MAG TPA: hypothetical protein VJZ77_18810 [Blastocatellia bacterium]|nr:hypothetical protein [Blastocatellia bacterium]